MADFARFSEAKKQAPNGFAYHDISGGEADAMPSFSSRVEDYTEIFSASSRASYGIPFLDLSLAVDEDHQTHFSTSHCDYSEIFGGFDSLDYALPYEELFFHSKVGPTSSQDVWTPAETGSPSEESSEDPVSSENNQAFSNVESHYGYDDGKQFNVSYHKTNQISKEDGISGTTHIAQFNAVPTYTFVVDENLPLHTAKCDSLLHEEINDCSLTVNNTDCRMDGDHFWETTPTQVFCGNDQKSDKNLDGKGTHTEKPFVTISEISLRTQPCEVPPPSRPPPKLTIKHGYHKSATSHLKYTANYTRHGTINDCSPPYYDVEVDSGSSAAASAAAMKEAMEIAQARLKSAKEMMERKKDGLQYRKKVGLNNCKGNEKSESEMAYSVTVEQDKSHIKLERKGGELKGFDRVEKEKSIEDAHESLDFKLQRGLFNLSEEYVEHKHPKECKLTEGSQRQEVIEEWKAEQQFYERVKNNTTGRAFIAAENKSRQKKLMPITTAYKHGENETQAEKVVFVQQEKSDGRLYQVKIPCEIEEDMKTFNVANEAGEREEHHQTTKTVQKVCDQEEHEKRHSESFEIKEFEKLNGTCAQEDYEKKLDETHEQKKECHEQEEYLKNLKETHEKKQKEGIERDENVKKMKKVLEQEEGERRDKEACEGEELARKKEDFERGEIERRQKETHQKKENEMMINEDRQMESRQREEKEKRLPEACEREETGRILKESQERQETERNLKQAAEESDRRLEEIGEMEENEKRQKVIEMEEYEFFLTVSIGRQESECKAKQSAEENECKAKQSAEENEWELQSIHQKEENERRETEECKREENENRLEVSYGREEDERKLKHAAEEHERSLNVLQEREDNMIHKSIHIHEENDKRLKDPCEDEVIDNLLQKETYEWVDNEKKPRDSQELKENRPEESCKCESQITKLEKANGQEQIKNRHSNTFEWDENEQFELAQNFHLSKENNNLKVDTLYVEVAEPEDSMVYSDVCMQDEIMNLEATRSGWEQEENIEQLNIDQEPCREESDNILKITQNASEHVEKDKNIVEDKVSYELDNIERLSAVNLAQSCAAECEGNGTAALKTKLDDSKKEAGNTENTVIEERDEQCMKEVPVVLNFKDTRKNVKTSQTMDQCDGDMKNEVVHPTTEEERRFNRNLADQFSTHQERKANNLKGNVAREVSGNEGRIKDREQEKERLKKLEEDRLREREREKDRIAVERVTREARERAFTETRERAERAAVERATAEVRQRAMLEARERLEKACAEAREKSLAEKAYAESRLKAERAAVERATAEARERAVEKAMAERAAMEARVDRSVSEKFSAVSRDRDLRHSASFSDMRNAQFQSTSSFSSSQRYTNTTNHSAFTNEKPQGTEVESAQRCKAKLERHQRTVERAAKALAEKNLRDHLAQREQAERNRLADTLDADVRRWSSGKEGNLRALLSTLQYILGPESGWQPVPLTDVITAVAVKKAYRKATLCVHPDKLQQRGASIQQKYICEKVFDLLKDAWSKFNSEER